MRFFSRGCESREAAYLVDASRLGARERMALEAHALTCADCADALRFGRPVDAALRGAFTALRERRTIIAPGRVRLAVGPTKAPEARNPWLRAPRFVGRLAEISVMVGVTLFAVGTSLEPSTNSSTLRSTPSVVQSYFRAQPPVREIDYVRWLRLVKPDASSTLSDPTHFPMGGRFDYDPVEFDQGPSASPR